MVNEKALPDFIKFRCVFIDGFIFNYCIKVLSFKMWILYIF